MKEVRITIDRDEMEEILHEHLGPMFSGLEIDEISGLSYGDVVVRLRKPPASIESTPIEMPQALPVSGDDDEPHSNREETR